jgi:Protein of unknown function (DUF3343).
MKTAEIVLTFPNARNALSGEKALGDAGVAVRVMSRPSVLGEGCGICLRTDEDNRDRTVLIVNEAGIEVEAIFLMTRTNGKSEYTRL